MTFYFLNKMYNNAVLTFILNSGEEYPISQQSSKLNDINPVIFQKLYTEKRYKVESDVSKESFLLFLNYLKDGKEPIITESNRQELFLLSQEFQIMKNIFYQKRIDYLHTIQLLQDKTNENKSQIEEYISINLDEYLSNIGDKLFNLPITSIHNILNNKKRNLTQHNLCYNLIKQNYERNHDIQIFSVLPYLDGKKLSDTNLDDSISSQADRNGFIVKIEFSYILDLKKDFDQYKNEQRVVIQQMQQQILELKKSLPDQNQGGEAGQFAVLNQQESGFI